jgi:hypothetical protein
MRAQRILCYLLLLGIVTCPFAFAQETDVTLLRERIINLQNQYPLGVRSLVACSTVTGYGSYEPLPDNKVKAGDVIFFYVEPQNPSTNKAEGTYEIWLTQDMFVFTAQQQEIFKKENAFEIHEKTSSPRLDIFGVNQLTLSEISPGQYLFKVIIHDRIKGEEASATWAFEVIQ